MTKEIPILKRNDEELPVPSEWRQTFIDVVDSFKNGDFQLDNKVDAVHTVSIPDAKRMTANVADYGDELISLSEETWKTSICLWRGNYWQVLIDLMTLDEGVSDLVLFVTVRENAGKQCFTVEDVHVP